MVWFVAGGCASCAASIPAVATRFRQLAHGGLRVLTLGLSGDFAAGKAGTGQLLAFAASAADQPVTRPGRSCGMASKSLSVASDPTGVPDEYVLAGPGGHIRYCNSVPDTTMAQLLAAAHRLTSRRAAVPTAAQ